MNASKEQTRSYKDLVRENMRLNSELRKISTELNRNHDYSAPKLQSQGKYKIGQLKNGEVKDLERRREDQLRKYKILIALKKQESARKLSTDDSYNSRTPHSKELLVRRQSEGKPKREQNSDESKGFNNQESIKLKKLKRFRSEDPNNDGTGKAAHVLRNSEISSILATSALGSPEMFKLHEKKLKMDRIPNLSQLNIEDIKKNDEQLLKWIRENIIGFNTSYLSAVHLPIETVYVDHTATNRPFKAVEILVDHAKLFAANPHTEFSRYGKFSTELMHYARDSLLRSFNVPLCRYCVLPTGGGSTGAIEKAVHFLKTLETSAESNWKNPMIFLTPYEHHSNILPWVEFYEKIEVLAHNEVGTLSLDKIYDQIAQCESSSIIISVSAASNVTSKITHLKELNQIIKKLREELKNKRIIFSVDCAAFCCHHELDLQVYDEIDFAFLSPHKNLGGAESCGVLVAKKSLMGLSKPTFPGGGTVKFVKGYSRQDIMYQVQIFSRQIAGTPPYFGFYRAALSFQLLKNTIGYSFIHKRENQNTKLFYSLIDAANQQMKDEGIDMLINIYGERDLNWRANVVTFNFEYGNFNFVQHSFASLVLTDIFGIQIRSGCFCAGPYGIQLLNIHKEMVNSIKEEVEAGIMINKPGYLRLDLTFYLEDYQIEYIAKAVILIARYWKNLLKLYTVTNGGEVVLLPVFTQKQEPEIYSLSQIEGAYGKLKQEAEDHDEKLKNRRKTLESQLKMGESISKNPVEFLKKFKTGTTERKNSSETTQ